MVGPIRRIKRNRRGTWDLRLPDEERQVLLALSAQLREMLTEDDPALRRLFPTAYPADAEAEAEAFYRQLTRDDLVDQRMARLDTFAQVLEVSEVTTEQLESAMGALNDLRLVLGTRLDVSEDDDPGAMDPDHPETPLYAVYSYLGWILEMVVDALFSSVPEDGFDTEEPGPPIPA
jgi:hypothetical protein